MGLVSFMKLEIYFIEIREGYFQYFVTTPDVWKGGDLKSCIRVKTKMLIYLWFHKNTNTICNRRASLPKRSEPSHISNFIGKIPKINFIFFWKIIYLEFFRNAFQVIFIVHFHWISKNPGNALPGVKGEFRTSQIGPYKIGKSVCKKKS